MTLAHPVRDVLARAVLALATLSAPGMAKTADVAAPALAGDRQVDIASHLRRDLFEEIKISPDGRFFAATVIQQDATTLAVLSRKDLKVVGRLPIHAGNVVADFHWASPERIVYSMATKAGSLAVPVRTGNLFAMDYDGGRIKRLVGYDNAQQALVAAQSGNGAPAGALLDTLADDDQYVLVTMRDRYARSIGRDRKPRVLRIDVVTGESTEIAEAPLHAARFLTDARGVVRFVAGSEEDNALKVFYRENDQADWKTLSDQAKDNEVTHPIGISAAGDAAYLQVERGDGPDVIVRQDLASGKRTQVLRDAVVDPGAIVRSRTQPAVPIGVHFNGPAPRTAFFDEDHVESRLFRKLERAFPGQRVWLTSGTRDGRLVLAQIDDAGNPGDYYLFDTETLRAEHVMSRRSWLDLERMGKTRAVQLKARDGLLLHGFLTAPVDAGDSPMPMLLVPHGGPFGVHDTLGFDSETQMLADAGYAVLRVNYRGSGNYGRRFREAGAKQWGLAMQDDLTDATRWAIEQGIADPGRICIYGASYGGYAALMGVAREPGLYRCAVGSVGVYDLQKLMDRDVRGEASDNWHSDWIGHITQLGSVSPVRLARKIRVPVLLVGGERDPVAPIYHTRDMAKALRRADVPVELKIYPDESHGFYRDENREDFARRLLAFLAPHLGGRTAMPPGANPATTQEDAP